MQVRQHKRRALIKLVAAGAAVVVAAAFPIGAERVRGQGQKGMDGQPQQVQMLELLWLQPNVTVDKAADYFRNKLRPILVKHHGEIIQSYEVTGTMRGELKPAWINVFRFNSMADMQAIFQDPEYAKLVPLRDATFDLSQHRLFTVSSVKR